MLNRRDLVRMSAAAAATVAFERNARAAAASKPIELRRGSPAPTPLPADFLGLGYEMSSVAPIGLLSANNERYVRLVRQLGPRGVLRVGGIVADYTRYDASGTPTADMHNTVITRQALEQFGGFLKAVGWTAIWSVNFAQGTLADAVAEAVAVNEVLGSSLQAFELGNEVENYARGRMFRKAPYTYETFHGEYVTWRAAILQAVPGARFAAPDTAENVEWVERMAQDARGDVQLLTTHYYRNGQKQGSAEQLTHADPRLLAKLVRLRAAAAASGIPWRMCETNSFSGGGLPGVSDRLLGALWTLDFLALLATQGCSGVNLETGVNQLGFVSSYSPIQDDGHANNTAGVPYYGMLAFAAAQTGCTESIALDIAEAQPNLTAYAFGNGGKLRSLILVNRATATTDISSAALSIHKASVQRLSGPTSDAATGVTFGDAAVDRDGHWAAATHERMRGGLLSLRPMSAAVVRAD